MKAFLLFYRIKPPYYLQYLGNKDSWKQILVHANDISEAYEEVKNWLRDKLPTLCEFEIAVTI